MKTLLTFTICTVMLLFTVSLCAAQTANNTPASSSQSSTPSLYVKTFYVSKIYPLNLGYKVNYWTSEGTLATTYIPLSWFGTTGGKGELVSEFGKSVPYMEIVYADGKFKLVRLHIAPTFNDTSWGSLTDGSNFDDKFKTDTLTITY